MKKKITIIGASGHGKVVADIARLNGYEYIAFLDDNDKLESCGNYPVIGRSYDVQSVEGDLFVAIGNARIRRQMIEIIDETRIPTLCHPNAIIANDVSIGFGTVIMPGAIVNPGSTIGNGCILNTGSSVDHDCIIHNYVHVAVGAHICGNVSVGDNSWIGAGATISNNVRIENNCTIGAGALVIHDALTEGVYIGIPAKRRREV